jgi:hypothetical protein
MASIGGSREKIWFVRVLFYSSPKKNRYYLWFFPLLYPLSKPAINPLRASHRVSFRNLSPPFLLECGLNVGALNGVSLKEKGSSSRG